jgi:hypothetical protein
MGDNNKPTTTASQSCSVDPENLSDVYDTTGVKLAAPFVAGAKFTTPIKTGTTGLTSSAMGSAGAYTCSAKCSTPSSGVWVANWKTSN